MFELTPGDRADDEGSPAPGPSFSLQGKATAHTARATGVAATPRRAVTVDEDGVAVVVDLQRLGGSGGGVGVGGDGAGDGAGCVLWKGQAKGAMPLAGVTFQGESEEVGGIRGPWKQQWCCFQEKDEREGRGNGTCSCAAFLSHLTLTPNPSRGGETFLLQL